MPNPKLYNRWQSSIVKKALMTRRVIVLSGARQCGKTTLAKALATKQSIYHTLDNTVLLDAARSDPHGFVKHDDQLMIIDEIQRAPELLLAIKMAVDANRQPGRFLLTGSANIQDLPNVQESLAGRVRMIRLRPLVLGEIYGTAPDFLKNAYKQKFNIHKLKPAQGEKEYSKDTYLSLALCGGYPEVRQLEQGEMRLWHQDYIKSLLARDLRDIVNIRRKDAMAKLLECLAAWSSKYMDVAGIGSGLSIQRPTVESYINALETLYLVEGVRPWTKTDYERVGKKDKLFLTDTGLMSSILNWTFEKIRLDGDKNGKLLETFVFTQLAAIIDAQDSPYELYHYRDRLKREIDFLVENEAGDFLGIEVKAGTSVSTGSFGHLKWFRENFAGKNNFIGIVLYTGSDIVRFGENMWAVPMNSLWA